MNLVLNKISLMIQSPQLFMIPFEEIHFKIASSLCQDVQLQMVPISSRPQHLKVGSCPNDDNFVQIYFCPFLCSI